MKHIHLGHSKSAPKHLLLHLAHAQKPFHHLHGGMMHSGRTTLPATLGKGIASPMKKDVGSMKSINGFGRNGGKKLTPLRFKL
jgi:hypothetical protein